MRFDIPDINTPRYWDRYYRGRGVDTKNLLRQEKYLEIIGDNPIYRVCELGCGMSYFPQMAATKYWESWGVDYASDTIDRVSLLFPDVRYECRDAIHTTLPPEYFDAVVAGEIIEHLKEPELLLNEMNRIAAKEGLLVISTATVEFKDPEHLWEFTDEELYDIMEPYGEPHMERIHSTKFPGRSYLFGWLRKKE